MKNNQLSEIIEIINDAEDMINGGWKTDHPEIKIHEARPAPEASRIPAAAKAPVAAVSHSELDVIAEEIKACTACGLYASRNQSVPGIGVIEPAVMIIGAEPDSEEDNTGLPFAGETGEYLDKWLSAIGLNRTNNCFVSNMIKCRPPEDREPYLGEIAACRPFLIRQLEIIEPDIVITLGESSSQLICNSKEGIEGLRGVTHSFENVPVISTYHPREVLSNPEFRSKVWADLKRAKDLLDEINRNR